MQSKSDFECINLSRLFIFHSAIEGERIWAGVDGVYGSMSMLEPVPTAKGSLCYYKSREGEDKWREAETFK